MEEVELARIEARIGDVGLGDSQPGVWGQVSGVEVDGDHLAAADPGRPASG